MFSRPVFVTLWTTALCPWDFSNKNTGVGCHFHFPGDLPNPGTEPTSPRVSCIASGFFTHGAAGETLVLVPLLPPNSIRRRIILILSLPEMPAPSTVTGK